MYIPYFRFVNWMYGGQLQLFEIFANTTEVNLDMYFENKEWKLVNTSIFTTHYIVNMSGEIYTTPVVSRGLCCIWYTMNITYWSFVSKKCLPNTCVYMYISIIQIFICNNFLWIFTWTCWQTIYMGVCVCVFVELVCVGAWLQCTDMNTKMYSFSYVFMVSPHCLIDWFHRPPASLACVLSVECSHPDHHDDVPLHSHVRHTQRVRRKGLHVFCSAVIHTRWSVLVDLFSQCNRWKET